MTLYYNRFGSRFCSVFTVIPTWNDSSRACLVNLCPSASPSAGSTHTYSRSMSASVESNKCHHVVSSYVRLSPRSCCTRTFLRGQLIAPVDRRSYLCGLFRSYNFCWRLPIPENARTAAELGFKYSCNCITAVLFLGVQPSQIMGPFFPKTYFFLTFYDIFIFIFFFTIFPASFAICL